MTGKQRFSVVMMVFLGAALAVLPVWMFVTRDGRLWAAELALLCAFAVMLLVYAREWRRQRDEQKTR